MTTALRPLLTLLLVTAAGLYSYAQEIITIRLIDKITREPIAGATVQTGDGHSYVAGPSGALQIPAIHEKLIITMAGYLPQEVLPYGQTSLLIQLEQQATSLQQVIVSANRQAQRRTEAPVAITNISPAVIQETKATTIDQLVNKSPGVFMVNLGSEQHMMSIRQPMSTKGLYLYLEDGIPIRTSGLFNHNALLEINMTAVKNIEIIRGPSSSIYGAEAIGGAINFITRSIPVVPTATVSLQGNDIGYRRADLSAGQTFGKLGFAVYGYYARNNNGVLDRSDFRKATGSVRASYAISNKTLLTGSFTILDYYSDMRGALDSSAYRKKDYSTPYSFNWRKVTALRFKTQLQHTWHNEAKTSVALIYRDNSIGQNPSYRIRDDYRRTGGTFTGNKSLAHGEINDNSFNSYAAIVTHAQQFFGGRLKTVSGISFDYSPSSYAANYIKVQQDSNTRKYAGYENKPDSLLSNYNTAITNAAAYLQADYALSKNFHLVLGGRFDAFRLAFNNELPANAFSGAPSTTRHFSRFTPKAGFTWQASKQIGFYGNYSQGFVAPQVTELFNGVKVPNLQPQTFYNYEAGGWISAWQQKIYAEWSVYRLDGTNEIITVLFDDGTSGNANAGKTRHTGIEYGVTIRPVKSWMVRFSGTNAKHRFIEYVDKNTKLDGKEMNGATQFIGNTEVSYKPGWFTGFRIGAEWQHNGAYWQDVANTTKDPGFDLVNLRLGYEWRALEVWCNVINVFDAYYSVNSSRNASGSTYTIGNPRGLNLGVSYTFSKKNN